MLLHTPEVTQGVQAPDFALPDFTGKTYGLKDIAQGRPFVVAFICNHCPYVQAIVEDLVKDAAALQEMGIGFVAINSNDYTHVPADSPPRMKAFAEHHGFTFPYLVDETQSVGREYGAVCTPDFFGFNGVGELQYRGRLNDFRMGGLTTQTERSQELVQAMRTILSTGKGPETQHASMGCSIKWKAQVA